MENAETCRLFIAVPMPEAIKTEIEKAQAELRRALPERGVRWTRPAQYHLTLRFLGDVDAEDQSAITAGLVDACRPFSALALRAERIGFFPDARFPRVVWAWVHDEAEQLPRLQAAIEGAVKAFTREPAEETFTGHVTLGRCQRIKRPEAEILAKLAEGMKERLFGEWTADRVELIRSELSPGGSLYTVVVAVPLTAPGDRRGEVEV